MRDDRRERKRRQRKVRRGGTLIFQKVCQGHANVGSPPLTWKKKKKENYILNLFRKS